MSKKIVKIFKTLFVLSLVIIISKYAYANWTGPGTAPILNNILAPINAGPIAQTMTGNLVVNSTGGYQNGLLSYGRSSIAGGLTVGSASNPGSLTVRGGSGSVFEIGTSSYPVTTFRIVTGNQGVGKVLTLDANGKADWVLPITLNLKTAITYSPTNTSILAPSSTELYKNKTCSAGTVMNGFDQYGNLNCVPRPYAPNYTCTPLPSLITIINNPVY